MRLQTGNWNQLKQKRKGGFTTIEVLVVVVLTLILAGGAVFGLSRWVSWTAFNQQNEAARTLFVAAQNQLTVYGENGRLSQIEKRTANAASSNGSTTVIFDGNSGTGTLLSVKDLDGNPYTSDTIWQNAANGRYKSEIYSIIGTSATYDQYLAYKAGTQTSIDDGILLLYQILEPYVYDTSLLHANICLEFDPADGQVFSLLYSDEKDNTGFTYTESETNRGVVSVSSRQADYRWARMTGYYGVSTLSTTGSGTELKPSLTDVRLENGDLLEMTFGIEATDEIRPTELIGKLNYKFVIYDDRKKPHLQFDLNLAGQKGNTWLIGAKHLVSTEVSRYNEDGQAQSLGEYNFLVWIDNDNHVHVVLDAADVGATTKLYQAAYLEKDASASAVDDLKKTLSFHRFGLDVDNIYYTVQATGAQCKPSAVRTSNTEHAYFGSVQRLTKINTGVQETQKTTEYAIQNARHLYNIRYEEDYQAEDAEALNENNTVTYRLEENIDWAEFCRHDTGGNKDDGLYWFGADTNSARFSLLSERDAQKATPTVFPSIRQLREYAIFTGQKNSGKIYKINGLEITAETNEAAQLYQTEEEKAAQSAGLFLQNYGTISAVKLDRIQVTGGKNVGAFCSVDSGTLKDLTVSNSDRTEQGNDAVKSVITGKENVGGIVGTWQPAKGVTEMTYEKLVNRAEVRESDEKKADDEKRQNFGGIIGSLEAKNGQTVTVQNCKNYGSLTAVHKDTENIGGIVGFAEAEINSTTTLKNCISSLQYPNLTMDDKTLKELLNGKYVGGIIGQSKNVSIENCSTEKEGNTEGYLFGNEYVGGIAGSYTTKSGDGTISGGEKNSRSVNELHVLGNQYVGGIVGKNESGTVSNWENRGFVAATTKFAGGIVGSNGNFVENETSTSSAVIQNCTSVVQSSDAVDALRKLDVFHANYVGGIAGYNNGVIRNDDATSIVVNVSGGSFVGGVTGYNDAHSQIINYGVGGGTVKGDGAYVGGFVGVNVSRDLFVDENENTHIIQSNPNSVVGDSFVGGTIGANLLLLDGGTTSQKEFVASFSSDNFLGIVQANKFLAGGFIGYNQLLPEDAAAPTLREKLEKAITTVKEDDFSTFAPEKVEKLFYEKSSDQSTFTIQGTGGNQHTNAKFGGIESQIYVGGVIGYNHSETTLKVNNVINQSPVTATSSIENDAEQSGNTYDDQAFTYSYAGGIIGKVGKKTTIDNCRNQDAGEVVTQGTYTGGICEVNEGTIQNCTVSSLGETDHDYVGGIVGLNKQGATIQGCTFEQKTVTGKNYVGGIAAENYGSISGITLNNVTVKANNIAGGIVGENKSGGQITVSSATVEMSASGENIGGIVGVNNGTITSLDKKNNVVISGSVSGKKTVGGIVGSNQFGTLEKFENQAAIKASNGNAGGIAGSNDATIKSCSNRGTVEATKGNAGGIAAVNRNMISGCKNYGEVDAKNGICGGTVAENAKGATVTGCQVLASSGVLTLTGKTLAGGIAGQNSGTISDSTVKSSTITNDADSKGSALGGIAGENTGTIKDASSVGEKNNPVTVLSNAADVNMGGAVGRNYGEMAGGFGTVTDEVYANLKFASGVLYGNVGGVVGANGGTVDQYQFTGTVEGTANNSQNAPTYDPNSDTETNGAVIYGYGGIAGVNGITEGEKEHSGTIYNCTVKTASITGQGDANNIVNVGGAAGVNHLGSTIHRITLSGEEKYSLMNANSSIYLKNAGTASVYVGTGGNSGNFGHVGGIVGLNSGEISDINVDKTKDPIVFDTKVDNTTVFVENYRGHVGGIVGYNRRTGIVKNVATGKSWVVFAVANAQDNGCGGIVGYQASEYGLQNCFNRATVEKTVKGGSNGVGGMKYVDNNNTVQTSWSQWADVTEEVKDNILPTPKYHLELELVNNSLQYRLYLDNKQDYVNFLKKQGITDEGALNSALSNLKMTVRNRTKTITAFNGMTVASETSTGTWKVTPENQVNVMYLSAVVSDGGNQYGSSIAQLRQSDMWGQSIYTGTSKIADVKLAAEDGDANVGFYGDTMDTLNYLLKIDKKKTSYYMRSELTAVDRELKVPVVVATSQLQVSDTSNTAISTQLSDLPEDLLDAEAYSDLFLRSYPAFMANNVVYMGHTVHGDNNQTTWTKEELAKLYVTEDHHVTTANTGAKLISGENLASGFVIEYGGEDTYSLYYNTLLDYNGKKSVNYKTGSTKTQMKNQVYFYDIDDSNLKKQPTPEVVHTYDEDTDQYLLTWDNDENGAKYNNATYDYRVLGSNETEEGPVTAQITADTVTAQAGTQNTYKNSGNTWDYTEVSAFVSHHGMVDTNGKTQIFPVGAKAQPDPQSLKRRLSQMTKPTVSLHKDASGKTQKDALQYDVKYKALPTAEQPHVGAYEITVERSENDTKAVATYLDNASYNSALEKLKALYAAKKQVSIENRDGEIIYRWTETTQTATIAKTMRLCFDCDTRIITKNLTSVWTFSDVISKKQTIDLNDYDRGEQLEISIRAIPHKMESNGKACPYRRGPKGVVAELTLPDRLEVPSVTNLASDPSYSKTGYMTLEEFANGLKLTYRSNSTYDIDGTYQVAVALYDEKGNHDTSKVSSDAWDADAVKTLIAKDADTGIMSGDLQSGSLTLYLIDETGALLDDYAGKWLKIAMRSVSDNQVSSFWSDEDEASEGTVNYAWIQIPRVQIATPEISDTAQSVTYPITGGDSTVTVKQTVLRMELPDHSDLHRIQIVRSEDQTTLKQDNKEYAVQYLDWIYLEPTETSGEYAVFYATTDPNTVFSSTETDAKKKNSKQDAPVGVKIGVLTEGSTLELPYQVTMKYPGNEAWTISVKSKLSLSKTADGTERVTLLLPDAEQVDIQSPNQDDLHTAQVSLQSLASQKQQSCYANSKINNWWRNGKQTELTELDGYSKLTDSTEKVNATWVEPTDKAYQKDYKLLSGSLKNYRLVYELTSQTGTSTKTQYYISAYGREDKKSNSMESYALVPEKYLNNGTVTIRVAAILPQSNLSSWEDGIVQPLTNQEKTQQNLDKVKDFLAQLQQREQERQQADGNMPAA